MYKPNYWKLVRLLNSEGEPVYKIFATWFGGYTRGDEWRMNSGITRVEEFDDHFYVYGSSGSVYGIAKYDGSYRTTGYTGSVLATYEEDLQGLMKVYEFDEALEILRSFKDETGTKLDSDA